MTDLFLGIDTSNYTTSAALLEGEQVVENRKKLFPCARERGGFGKATRCFTMCASCRMFWVPFWRSWRAHASPWNWCVCFLPQPRKIRTCPAFWWGKILPDCWARRGNSSGALLPPAGTYCGGAVFRWKAGAFRPAVFGVSCVRRNHRGFAGSAWGGRHAPGDLSGSLPGFEGGTGCGPGRRFVGVVLSLRALSWKSWRFAGMGKFPTALC